MTIPWAQITDAETRNGALPTSILFQKLYNNPRAVLYGDITVPYGNLVKAEFDGISGGCLSPTTGAFNDFLLSNGLGGITVGAISFASLLSGQTLQPGVQTVYTPFPVAGVYTIMLWGNGGAGAGAGPGNYAGGAGGFVKVYVTVTAATQITVSGFTAGQPAYVFESANAWRLDATAGSAGSPSTLSGGASGAGAFKGFAKGYAYPGGTSQSAYGGRSAGGIVGASFGAGGGYALPGNLGGVLIARGVH